MIAKMFGIFDKGQKIKGTVVLMPKNVLDFNAITSVGKGSAKDTATDFLGKGLDALGHAVDALTAFAGHSISLQLISATQTDVTFFSPCSYLPQNNIIIIFFLPSKHVCFGLSVSDSKPKYYSLLHKIT